MSKKIPEIKIKSKRSKSALVSRNKVRANIYCVSPSLLYRLVYKSRWATFLVLLLTVTFLTQNLTQVFAAEPKTELETETILVTTEELLADYSPVIFKEEVTVDPIESETVTNEPEAAAEVLIPESTEPVFEYLSTTTASSTTTIPEETSSNQDDESLDQSIYDESSEGETLEVSEEESGPYLEVDAEAGMDSTQDNSHGESESPVDEEEFQTEEFEAVPDTVVMVSTHSDSAFNFSEEQCTAVADGSYYCHKIKENTLNDALFSAPDEDGDLEIFLVRDGLQTQVTNNKVDDAAPYFDNVSNTIVWHRLLDDRYQIVSYDIKADEETQLTFNSINDMEPSRLGSVTVWQRWVDNGWNIIMFDGKTESQLTATVDHDIAPHVHGSLIVWNRSALNGSKTIEMYDINSKSYISIEDPEGLSVSNPRMVVVYDSLQPNGDVATRGYDILARKFITLDTLPKPLPEDVPGSDSTGETRALIQPKPIIKDTSEEVKIDSNEVDEEGETVGSIVSDLPKDLDMRIDNEIESKVMAETEVDKSVDESFDLEIPAYKPVKDEVLP